MKVTVFHIKSEVPKKYYEFYDKFIKYLQKEYPLKTDIDIKFVGDRSKNMTTGSSSKTKKRIIVLTGERLNRDILRTLAHEWIHQYQGQILNRKSKKEIGGKNENEANAISGTLIKKFERDNPSDEPKMYNDEKTARKSRKNSQSDKKLRDKG